MLISSSKQKAASSSTACSDESSLAMADFHPRSKAEADKKGDPEVIKRSLTNHGDISHEIKGFVANLEMMMT